MGENGGLPDVITIDVEDWFHIMEVEGAPALSEWEQLPARVERNFLDLLQILEDANVKASCFTLGWVADRFPGVLREASQLGHEIASHGYGHQPIHLLSRAQFREDIRRAKGIIEDATGKAVNGYRAPGFSITRETSWALNEIAGAGYGYDSSIFPGRHGHGGVPDAPRHPHRIQTEHGELVEFPSTMVDTALGPLTFFGGGYLRLFPMPLIAIMARRVRNSGRGVMWYVHPREIDPTHPRVEMSAVRRFKSYVGLKRVRAKLTRILSAGNFATLEELVPAVRRNGEGYEVDGYPSVPPIAQRDALCRAPL
jgi:polysaccharide deacetylase family protein (PEP-CTERM system associated)